MCRSLDEGGRRCPHSHASNSRAAQAARQRLSRARRRLAAAEAAVQAAVEAGDADTVETARANLASATANVASAQAGVAMVKSAGDLDAVVLPKPPPPVPGLAPVGVLRPAVDNRRWQGPAASPASPASTAALTPPAVDAPIEEWASHAGQVCDQLAGQAPGRMKWVSLADVRRALGDAPREVQDKALRAMSRSGEFAIVPDSNRKGLTQADHDAALRIGGQSNHMITRLKPR